MSNSILSWDDFEEEAPEPTVPVAAPVAPSPAVEQKAAPAPELVPQKRTESVLNIDSNELMRRAIASLETLDGQLEHGERLRVEEKKLLNSATDLNQLVPFKYDWAWSGYLESCTANWMPMEVHLEKDLVELEELSVNSLKLVTDLINNHQYMRFAVPNIAWLNLYRMLENPEARQYLLRQTFEETVADHAISHIQESTGILFREVNGMSLTGHLHLLQTPYRERHTALRTLLPMMTGDQGTTVGDDNLRAFLIELILLYCFVDWICPIRPIYHILKLHRQTGKLDAMTTLCQRMLRDLVHHQQMAKLIIETAIAENGHVATPDFRLELTKKVKLLRGLETDLNSVLSVDGDDYKDLEWLAKYTVSQYMTLAGIHTSGNDPMPSPHMTWFMELIESYEVKLHGGGNSVTGGGAISW